jgi:hypothetical protein
MGDSGAGESMAGCVVCAGGWLLLQAVTMPPGAPQTDMQRPRSPLNVQCGLSEGKGEERMRRQHHARGGGVVCGRCWW